MQGHRRESFAWNAMSRLCKDGERNHKEVLQANIKSLRKQPITLCSWISRYHLSLPAPSIAAPLFRRRQIVLYQSSTQRRQQIFLQINAKGLQIPDQDQIMGHPRSPTIRKKDPSTYARIHPRARNATGQILKMKTAKVCLYATKSKPL